MHFVFHTLTLILASPHKEHDSRNRDDLSDKRRSWPLASLKAQIAVEKMLKGSMALTF
jgi:hypothetical protein